MAVARRPDDLKIVFLLRRRAHFQKHVFLVMFVKNQPYDVIRVRPAPSFDQYGLLASTACTFLRRLMFILFWYLLKPARLCGGRPLLGRLGCLLEAPGPPREARPPEALQGGGLGRLGLSLGSLGTSFGKFPGSRRHPKVVPRTGPL